MSGGYALPDEPTPGGLAQWTVQPFWPLLAIMFGGAGVSWIWFVFNAFAMGSPTRLRETLIAVGGFVGGFALLTGIVLARASGLIGEFAFPYWIELILFWKIGVSYWLFAVQGRTFPIYAYYGGPVRSGLIVVFVGWFFVQRALIPKLIEAVGIYALVVS